MKEWLLEITKWSILIAIAGIVFYCTFCLIDFRREQESDWRYIAKSLNLVIDIDRLEYDPLDIFDEISKKDAAATLSEADWLGKAKFIASGSGDASRLRLGYLITGQVRDAQDDQEHTVYLSFSLKDPEGFVLFSTRHKNSILPGEKRTIHGFAETLIPTSVARHTTSIECAVWASPRFVLIDKPQNPIDGR